MGDDERQPRAPVAGMQIVGDGARRDAEDVLQAGQRFLEKLHGLEVFQIADVLAEDGVAALGEAEGVLQLAAEGQDLVQFDSQVDGLRNKAAGAAQYALATLEMCARRNRLRGSRYRDCAAGTSRRRRQVGAAPPRSR